IEVALLSWAKAHCAPPLDKSKIVQIARSMANYKQEDPRLSDWTKLVKQEPVEITAIPYPVFPDWIFGGIAAYDKWVEPLCEINSRYAEYMMLPLMVLIMNYLSQHVSISFKLFPLSIFLLLVGRKGRVIKS